MRRAPRTLLCALVLAGALAPAAHAADTLYWSDAAARITHGGTLGGTATELPLFDTLQTSGVTLDAVHDRIYISGQNDNASPGRAWTAPPAPPSPSPA